LQIIVFAPEIDNGAPGSIYWHYKCRHIIATLDANVTVDYFGDIYFTVDVTGLSVSSLSLDVSGIPGEYNTDFTPTAIVSVSGGTSLYHSATWSFSSGSATISLSFTSSTTNEGYYVPSGTYTVLLHSWGILTQQP